MTTKTQLLNELHEAEAKLAIAKQEETSTWKRYSQACDAYYALMISSDRLVEIGKEAEAAIEARKARWQEVNALKTALLELDTLTEATAEADQDDFMHITFAGAVDYGDGPETGEDGEFPF